MHSHYLRTSFPAILIVTALAQTLGAADNKGGIRSAAAYSQQGLQAPVMGFVAEPDSGRLRPVVGLPGAALLGPSAALPDTVARMKISPAGSFVLVERSDDRPLSVLRAPAGEAVTMEPITGALSRYDLIEFNSSGSAAAGYSAALRRIQVLTGLPDSPAIAREVDMSSFNSPVTSLGISDDASVLLAGVSDGQSGGVYRIDSERGVTKVVDAGRPAALRFVPGADSALMADSQLSEVWLISGITGTLSVRRLAGPEDGADEPAPIALLTGTRTAAVANLHANTLLLIDLERDKVSTIPISAPVVSLEPLALRGALALRTASPSAYWLLSAGPDAPVISFLPDAAMTAAETGRQ